MSIELQSYHGMQTSNSSILNISEILCLRVDSSRYFLHIEYTLSSDLSNRVLLMCPS